MFRGLIREESIMFRGLIREESIMFRGFVREESKRVLCSGGLIGEESFMFRGLSGKRVFYVQGVNHGYYVLGVCQGRLLLCPSD
jgi:hypothetical protein